MVWRRRARSASRRALAAGAAFDAIGARFGRAARVRDERADVGSHASAEHRRFQQRIGGEPVGAMQAGRGDLADGPQAFDSGAAAHVGGDAAHVIVRGGRDRNEPVHGIDAGARQWA